VRAGPSRQLLRTCGQKAPHHASDVGTGSRVGRRDRRQAGSGEESSKVAVGLADAPEARAPSKIPEPLVSELIPFAWTILSRVVEELALRDLHSSEPAVEISLRQRRALGSMPPCRDFGPSLPACIGLDEARLGETPRGEVIVTMTRGSVDALRGLSVLAERGL